MKINRFSLAMVLALFVLQTNAQISPFIHVDQFGYRTTDPKVAVLSNPQTGFNAALSYTPGSTIELKNALDGSVVWSGTPTAWNNGATHAQSGDQGWWLNFSSFTTPGDYYLYDPTNNEQSATFAIRQQMYEQVLNASMKMFYYNRCNFTKAAPFAANGWTDGMNFMNNLQDANCRFIDDPNNSALEKDLHGGWFDAGDYNKYVTFVYPTIHNLLWAFKENANVFSDNTNIPESGNGIPDILDELKWELDWLLRMHNSDGSTILKMGSKNYAENTSAPPSANTDPRYYGPTCTSASIAAAAMFAHAATIYAAFPSMSDFADDLETAAVQSWDYFIPFFNANTLETDCDNGSIVAGDADWTITEQHEAALTAAVHLFELTGDADYNTHVQTNVPINDPIISSWWGGYKISLYDALLHYTTLPGSSSSVSSTIRNSLMTAANNNWDGFYGFSNSDLYRAFMPDAAYHWGSSSPKSAYALLNMLLVKYNINPANQNDYKRKALEQLHYFHGVNPLGLVYLSNMYDYGGDRCVNEIYHTWFADQSIWDNAITSTYGPAPGYVSGGANSSFTIASLSPPFGQPDQKSYLDFNDDWPNNSWEISEPSQAYQGIYVRHLAWFAQPADISLSVELLAFDATCEEALQRTVIEWQTASETDNDHFLLEKSNDGRNWTAIKKIEGLESSQTLQHYFVEDINAFGLRNYYRLKQVDLDGSFRYSDMLTAECLLEGSISLQPNPTSDVLQIKTEINQYTVRVSDLTGRTVIQKTGGQEEQLDLENLANGVYQIIFTDQTGRVIDAQKVVKQDE
ncbi:MAG: glycoside hydrolase family 9 protein [Bacteroidota bacterium]